MCRGYGVITVILKYFFLRKPGVTNFLTPLKSQPRCFKQPLETQQKLKELEDMY